MALRVGMIGCGSTARAHAVSLRLLAEDGGARLVAVADPDPAGAERVVAIAGSIDRCYTDGADLVAAHAGGGALPGHSIHSSGAPVEVHRL